MHTLVIIPAYNEAGNIARVVRAVRDQGYDCLVVDDGSRDGTGDAARAAGADVVSNRVNRGLGRTIRLGYEEALRRGADVIVQMDADSQYDPAQIPLLLSPIESGDADMVLGARLKNLRFAMPATKRLGNKAFTLILRLLTGADVKDGQTGFRAMHRDVAARCLPINEFSYTQEMIIRVVKEGFRVKSVPINFYPRSDQRSRLFHHPLDFAMKGWWIIVRTMRDYHPFRFFFWPGLAILLASAIPAGITLSHFLQHGVLTGRFGTFVTAGILFMLGIQLMFLGLLADMIRTHTQY